MCVFYLNSQKQHSTDCNHQMEYNSATTEEKVVTLLCQPCVENTHTHTQNTEIEITHKNL